MRRVVVGLKLRLIVEDGIVMGVCEGSADGGGTASVSSSAADGVSL